MMILDFAGVREAVEVDEVADEGLGDGAEEVGAHTIRTINMVADTRDKIKTDLPKVGLETAVVPNLMGRLEPTTKPENQEKRNNEP